MGKDDDKYNDKYSAVHKGGYNGGYSGNILHVDLTNQTSKKEDLNYNIASKFIGGLGVSVKLAYDFMKPGVEPLSPENTIVLGAGTLVGTYVPGATRIFAVTKYPINNIVGWCGGGGMHFGCMMKNAGYDHIVIKGALKKPSILQIFDDKIEFCDAESIWGKGIDYTTEYYHNKFGKPLGVISIGQAGEKLVKYSMAMVDGVSSFGRGGVGAVFGYKNLKAIVIRGTKGVKVADKKRFKNVCNGLFERIRKYPLLEECQKFGLLMGLPTVPKDIYSNTLFKARMACIGCPISDKDLLQIKGGKFNGYTTASTSVTNAGICMLYGISGYDEAVKLLGLLDEYGMDMFEFFGALDFAKKLSKNKLLGSYSDSKIEFKYQNVEKWIKKTANREGLGDVLAEGVIGMVKEFGEKTQILAPATSKGLLTYISPKGPLVWKFFGTQEFGQILGIRGPHAAPAGSPTYFAQRPLEKFPRLLDKIGVPEKKIEEILPELKDLEVGMLLKYANDNFMVMASLGLCARAQINRFYNTTLYPELYSSATGIEKTREEIILTGERIYNLLKLINIREGHNKRDKIPDQWLIKPLFKEYTGKGNVDRQMIEKMIDEYYNERGWDKNGIPTEAKLIQLDLEYEMKQLTN